MDAVQPFRGERQALVRGEMTRIDRDERLISCPWFLLHRSPAIAQVSEMYEWREKGGLSWRDVPVLARRAVTAFARGVSRRQARELEKQREERERKAAQK